MAWNLNSDRPIYQQIVEIIELQILSGQYPGGSKLPSVRELAAEAGVTPNTMQKAFAELERRGLVITQRTAGRSVTEDQSLLEEIRTTLAKEQINVFIQKMTELGYSREDLKHVLNRALEEGEKA